MPKNVRCENFECYHYTNGTCAYEGDIEIRIGDLIGESGPVLVIVCPATPEPDDEEAEDEE